MMHFTDDALSEAESDVISETGSTTSVRSTSRQRLKKVKPTDGKEHRQGLILAGLAHALPESILA